MVYALQLGNANPGFLKPGYPGFFKPEIRVRENPTVLKPGICNETLVSEQYFSTAILPQGSYRINSIFVIIYDLKCTLYSTELSSFRISSRLHITLRWKLTPTVLHTFEFLSTTLMSSIQYFHVTIIVYIFVFEIENFRLYTQLSVKCLVLKICEVTLGIISWHSRFN